MATTKVKGVCRICEKEYAASSLLRHIKTHLTKETAPKQNDTHFLIRANAGHHYMYILAPLKSHLYDLDHFLRNYWMECCGHLSSFMVDREEIDMDQMMRKIFYDGFKCEYVYDWGSSTYVDIEIKGAYALPNAPKELSILVRNNPPDALCGQCEKKQATILVMKDYYNGKNPFYCADCHDEDTEYYHRVTNSPRMGVCGYDGESDDDEQEKISIS